MSFAKEQRFSPEKASAFFSIMKETHQHCISNPYANMEKEFAFFKDLLLKHSIHRPPFSDRVFSFSEMKVITDYATNTYFRHYLMYKYAFTKKIRMDFRVVNAEMTPPAVSTEELDPNALSMEQPDMDLMNLIPVNADGTPLLDGTLPIDPSVAPADATAVSPASAHHEPHDARPVSQHDALQKEHSTVGAANIAAELTPAPAVGSEQHAPGSAHVAGRTSSTSVTGADSHGVVHDEPGKIAALAAASIPDEHAVPVIVGEDGTPIPAPRPTREELAATELKNLVLTTLGPKLEEMRQTLLTKLASHEEGLQARIKKLEADEERLLLNEKQQGKGEKSAASAGGGKEEKKGEKGGDKKEKPGSGKKGDKKKK
ncbi:hypothetical protein HK101_010326 [Irineochytrium annulatum]|nr:hypothetical protein HK101_010326 [Irineochytrium annulatum]